MNILVTGASGFVGSAILDNLSQYNKINLRGTVRGSKLTFPKQKQNLEAIDFTQIDCLSSDTNWDDALRGIEVVIHTAARAHVMNDTVSSPLTEFRKVNVDGTLNLARQAAASGVKRFIFISSIKVNGEVSPLDSPFSENSLSDTQDPYGVSKCEAEQGLRQISEEASMEVVIIRPPLVYGPGVKGNFKKMVNWVGKSVPLPFGSINNKRSLVGVDNLVDFIVTCIDHPAAANQTFVAADGEDLSTTELLQRLANAMGKPARLLPVPAKMLEFTAGVLGKPELAQRLCGNLQVDISKARELLGWEPPVSVDEGLKRCVANSIQTNTGVDNSVIRFYDVLFSGCGLLVGFPLLLMLTIIGLFDTGSPIFKQERVGRQQQPFILIKFRTMKIDTASVASHLASVSSITKFGHFLRRTKLDELPQLWNVLKGEMSLVGPRPCLFNQEELIYERGTRGVFNARPGVTGLAQVNKIDMSTPRLLAETDQKMLETLSVKDYFRYIFMTVAGKGSGDRVKM